MIECEVINLPPHEKGSKILMHDADAELYHNAGHVKMTDAPPPAEAPAADVEGDDDAE